VLASGLLGRVVTDRNGQRCGIVIELRIDVSDAAESPRMCGLLVGDRHRRLLGYERSQQHGPRLIKRLVRRWHRRSVFVPWDRIDTIGPDQVRLRCAHKELPRLFQPRQ
jgi:sporulation protein YlmC with PRC-barrel domain